MLRAERMAFAPIGSLRSQDQTSPQKGYWVSGRLEGRVFGLFFSGFSIGPTKPAAFGGVNSDQGFLGRGFVDQAPKEGEEKKEEAPKEEAKAPQT